LSEKSQNLNRREFVTMAAGSAAIAAPFVKNMTGKVAEVMAAEEKTYKKTYYINDNCILCPPFPCRTACPVKAISFDGDKFAIDPEKCTQCGKCEAVCEIGAIVDGNAQSPVYKPHDIIYRECDFLVIGGGLSGLVAATIAADLSGKGKKIIVLEKAKRVGGSGFYPSTGIKLFGTKWQRDAGDPDQMDDSIRSAMDVTRWELNSQLVANSYRAVPAFFDWFCTWGKAEEIFALAEGFHSKSGKEIIIKNLANERCRKVVHKLIAKCTEMGVEFLTEHAATEFIAGNKNEITGVIAKDPGGTTVINCKYCLVSTGNLTNCSTMLAHSDPEYHNAFKRRSAHRMPMNTGDGVLMAEKAGIPVDYDNICVIYTGPNACNVEPQIRNQDQRGEAIYVNLNGKRWVNEGYVQLDVEGGFLPILRRQPRCMFYTVMDSKIVMMDPMPLQRISTTNDGAPAREEKKEDRKEEKFAHFYDQEKPNLKELQRIASLKGNHIFIADTLEELADKMGVDGKTFIATVKRYNELCTKGHDDDYFKPATYLLPIEKGPFYASSHFLGTDGAVGGLYINENMQVMSHNGPLENLYAAGDTTGGHFISRGGTRSSILPDGTWAVASGFVVGENIGKKLKKS
jgi:fumarate reductase flavoprotein subunit